jgi:hypothetical protein
VAGDGAPAFYQFEGPLVRLISDEGYHVYVHGSQQAVLDNASTDLTKAPSIWVYRFYDQLSIRGLSVVMSEQLAVLRALSPGGLQSEASRAARAVSA